MCCMHVVYDCIMGKVSALSIYEMLADVVSIDCVFAKQTCSLMGPGSYICGYHILGHKLRKMFKRLLD